MVVVYLSCENTRELTLRRRACRLYQRNGFTEEHVVQFGPDAAKKEGIPTETTFDIVFFVKPLSTTACHASGAGVSARVDGMQLPALALEKRSAILRLTYVLREVPGAYSDVNIHAFLRL